MKKKTSLLRTHVVADYMHRRIAVVKDKLTGCYEGTQAERKKLFSFFLSTSLIQSQAKFYSAIVYVKSWQQHHHLDYILIIMIDIEQVSKGTKNLIRFSWNKYMNIKFVLLKITILIKTKEVSLYNGLVLSYVELTNGKWIRLFSSSAALSSTWKKKREQR
jgi:hypothetical protein